MSASDASKVTCQGCGRAYKWQANLAGRKVRCKCSAMFVMPTEDPALAAGSVEDDFKIDLSDVAAAEQQSKSEISSAYDVAGPQTATPAAQAPSVAASAASTGKCPECGTKVNPAAVICINCGFNLKEGKKLATETGGVVRATTGPRGKARSVDTAPAGGFFFRMSRGWQFAKISYGIIWDFKQLLLFPVISGATTILVLISFIVPLWANGVFQRIAQSQNKHDPLLYLVAFGFYFLTSFVIVFFNTALTACAMKVTAGEAPTVGYGLRIAVKRIPQIAAWALLSAVIGVILRIIENLNEKVGWIVAAILGSAWTMITYFVVPILAVEGIGPFKALKESVSTIKTTWGQGLVGNFSFFLSFLIVLPLYILLIAAGVMAAMNNQPSIALMLFFLFVIVALVHLAVTSAAQSVFRALLYNYATGRSMPADIDENIFATAFGSKG